jgi:hypothetical protein
MVGSTTVAWWELSDGQGVAWLHLQGTQATAVTVQQTVQGPH